ncbi:GNAT family N-acetyltransferase [Cellulosimicrobium sp. PMB13]|uniref:GNAT family N-acetyltransferase n=1 Tax=Cellulosimicrobium sp. PMB13 TaxID=3120158 RepID=UPI003F4C8A0C
MTQVDAPARDLVVRRAGVDDVPAIQAVGLLTWPRTYLPFTAPDHVVASLATWWTADAVRAAVVHDLTVVSEVEGRVTGMATLGRIRGEHVIWRIYVVPEQHRTGTGAALMRAVLEAVPEHEDVLVELVEGNERARSFYERFGFVRERSVPEDDGTTTLWYRRRHQE